MSSGSRLAPAAELEINSLRPDAAPTPDDKPLVSLGSPILKDIKVQLSVKLGHADMSLGALLALKAGSVVTLDARMNDLIELHLNGTLVARGEIVAVDDHFGVRIAEIAELS